MYIFSKINPYQNFATYTTYRQIFKILIIGKKNFYCHNRISYTFLSISPTVHLLRCLGWTSFHISPGPLLAQRSLRTFYMCNFVCPHISTDHWLQDRLCKCLRSSCSFIVVQRDLLTLELNFNTTHANWLGPSQLYPFVDLTLY